MEVFGFDELGTGENALPSSPTHPTAATATRLRNSEGGTLKTENKNQHIKGVRNMNIPIATYRVQLNSAFGFESAGEVVEYLEELGVSHLYASPILKARKASVHGYDTVDPGLLNPELGTEEQFEALIDKLKKANMGWIQDIVPNHLAYDFENPALRDLMEHGADSAYLEFFDIDWEPGCMSLTGKLATPFLGDHYDQCLLRGEISLGFDQDGFSVAYYDFKMPLAIKSYAELLSRADEESRKVGKTDSGKGGLAGFASRFEASRGRGPGPGRDEAISDLKTQLWDLYNQEPDIAAGIDGMLRIYNGDPDDEKSFLLLDKLLAGQNFKFRFWRTAGEEINYRRFFDINDLIALRQEHEPAFLWSHGLFARFVEEGKLDGVRVDHVDGLAYPGAYLRRLRDAIGKSYLVVEKILEQNEQIPESWPVQGATGYEFSQRVQGLFVRTENKDAMKAVFSKYSRDDVPFEEILYSAKRQIIHSHFMGDLDNLVSWMQQLATRIRSGADITRPRLKAALLEIAVRFPVYRTYSASGTISSDDKTYIGFAMGLSTMHRPDLLHEFEFVQKVLLKTYRVPEDEKEDLEEIRRRAATLFEQLAAPLMAKGLEDTALYRYPLLLSLNEVGSSPDRFGTKRRDFHDFMTQRAKKWPHAMSGSSTHDSKRGEDVRARLNVLSEIPDQWKSLVSCWHALNKDKKTRLKDAMVPDDADEYFIYQTLVGSWPLEEDTDPPYLERLEEYMLKSMREAKLHTSWRFPDEDYEAGTISFVQAILEKSGPKNHFLEDFLPFCRYVARCGFFNSLSQTLIKITAPGVPDFYQGDELMNLNLVDPDNRRPVDYAKRRKLVREMRESAAENSRESFPEIPLLLEATDRLKLFLTMKGLENRKKHFALYRDGSYIPLEVSGARGENVVAFARRLGDLWSVTAAPRFLAGLILNQKLPLGPAVWEDAAAELPSGAPEHWNSILTGERITAKDNLPMGEIFESFPGALLIGGA